MEADAHVLGRPRAVGHLRGGEPAAVVELALRPRRDVRALPLERLPEQPLDLRAVVAVLAHEAEELHVEQTFVLGQPRRRVLAQPVARLVDGRHLLLRAHRRGRDRPLPPLLRPRALRPLVGDVLGAQPLPPPRQPGRQPQPERDEEEDDGETRDPRRVHAHLELDRAAERPAAEHREQRRPPAPLEADAPPAGLAGAVADAVDVAAPRDAGRVEARRIRRRSVRRRRRPAAAQGEERPARRRRRGVEAAQPPRRLGRRIWFSCPISLRDHEPPGRLAQLSRAFLRCSEHLRANMARDASFVRGERPDSVAAATSRLRSRCWKSRRAGVLRAPPPSPRRCSAASRCSLRCGCRPHRRAGPCRKRSDRGTTTRSATR